MKTKGKISVSVAIIEALKDTAKQCELNGLNCIFTKYSLNTRIRAYVGSNYYADDERIGREMRKLREKGRILYAYKGNGIYEFKVIEK